MIDKHHVLHYRRGWEVYNESKYLRESPSLIVRGDRNLHEELHEACPPIPMLGYHALRRTVELWTPDKLPSRSMNELCDAIQEAGRHYKCHPIERELADLAIEAIQIQMPFIKVMERVE